MRRTLFALLSVFIAAASSHSTAQHQLVPVAALKGEPALELGIGQLGDHAAELDQGQRPGREGADDR